MNEVQLKQVFAESLGIDQSLVVDALEFNSIPEWDSVAHMTLVAAIDRTFDVTLETEDVINMSSFAAAKEILKKYASGK
jgi:acyl carrier protein